MFDRLGAAILLVGKMERSAAFYRDILGMKIKLESPDWVEFVNESRSAVLALHPKRTKSIRSHMLVGFNVGDIENVCKELERKNVTMALRLSKGYHDNFHLVYLCHDYIFQNCIF
jgi:lactoylglutathione lyase